MFLFMSPLDLTMELSCIVSEIKQITCQKLQNFYTLPVFSDRWMERIAISMLHII